MPVFCHEELYPAFSFLLCATLFCPKQRPQIFTTDIDNFWVAYDSVRFTSDSAKQHSFLQTLYIDRGAKGLKAFTEAREYSAALWADLIRLRPKFWNSIRPNTPVAKTKAKEILQSLQRLKTLYPEPREAMMYFTAGRLRSGGTVMQDVILTGGKVATGNATTDVSEFPGNWLAGVFKSQEANSLVLMKIHEAFHWCRFLSISKQKDLVKD